MIDPGSSGGAEFDRSGRFRYHLWRSWDRRRPQVTFVMLNPSTADARRDDPTIRRCLGFARRWGYGSLMVVNLFAYRATDPRDLMRAADPVGPDNDRHLLAAVRGACCVVAAWGNAGALLGRDRVVGELLDGRAMCLGTTRQGQPRHPLYVPADTPPISSSHCGLSGSLSRSHGSPHSSSWAAAKGAP